VNYDNSLVVTITVTCYSRAPSIGDHLFTCGAIYRPPHQPHQPPLPRTLHTTVMEILTRPGSPFHYCHESSLMVATSPECQLGMKRKYIGNETNYNRAGWELDPDRLSPILADSNMLEHNHQVAQSGVSDVFIFSSTWN